MWYFYVLESSKNKILYKGYSSDLKQRILDHNKKRGGKYSQKNAPYRLIYYEAYLNKTDAMHSEKFYKTGYGREILKEKLSNYLKGW